jgi:hypothetical protein
MPSLAKLWRNSIVLATEGRFSVESGQDNNISTPQSSRVAPESPGCPGKSFPYIRRLGNVDDAGTAATAIADYVKGFSYPLSVSCVASSQMP